MDLLYFIRNDCPAFPCLKLLVLLKGQSVRSKLGPETVKYEEHKCGDPKDGELCLASLDSGETLTEDSSESDMQIDHDANASCSYLKWSRRP